jgi:hypothetical protein
MMGWVLEVLEITHGLVVVEVLVQLLQILLVV